MSLTAKQRKYQREYARKRRDQRLLDQQRAASVCPKRHGSGICGGKLETTTDTLGRTIIVCAWCDRQRRGICRHCPRPVDGTVGYALRCADHKEMARREQVRRSEREHHDERLQRARASYQNNDTVRERRNEYKRVWRKANPDKVKAQKRREALRQNPKRLAWHRRHNAKKTRQLRKRQQATLAYYREHPTRPIPVCRGCQRYLTWTPLPNGRCGAPPKWCDNCAPTSEKLRRHKLGRSIQAVDEPPAIAYVPPLRELERRVGARTCLTCPTVVTGRAKKCAVCKQREIADARRHPSIGTGRGRRVDLMVAA